MSRRLTERTDLNEDGLSIDGMINAFDDVERRLDERVVIMKRKKK
jgi:hypothetical protein